ncbi:unnamed protein product [Calicophoron daubneyi]|uniref:PPM-type phosphatase domain-containing protein n=1 Tax=Calicophoron daubneyi TaxID=300641 RepID=A0AAV2TBU1_CALDB
MAAATKTVTPKHNDRSELGLIKSWSFKERIQALRRNLTWSSSEPGDSNHCADQLRSQFRTRSVTRCDVWRALSPAELPSVSVYQVLPYYQLSKEVFASITGPGSGLLAVQRWPKAKIADSDILKNWKTLKNRKAHGISVSLYEKNPLTNRTTGDPNADAFVVRARCNSAVLAAADGVNWGRDSMQAARCAIYSVYEYLEKNLYGPNTNSVKVRNTREAAQMLFEAFSSAQERIVACTTGLTTLCVALVLPVSCNQNESSDLSVRPDADSNQLPPLDGLGQKYATIVVSVGDSRAFLLSKFHGIREVTGWVPCPTGTMDNGRLNSSEEQNQIWLVNSPTQSPNIRMTPPPRDFRDAGGALGPVHKNGNPELNNLICAVTLCDPGDIVLLGSDGLTDNFDPVVTQIAMPESPQLDFVDEDDELELSPGSSSEALTETSMTSDHSVSSTPARSWFNPLRLSPPPPVSIWPKPPPPPTNTWLLRPDSSSSPQKISDFTDSISAKSLNFTNRLELNWYERRRYAGKELEKVWHETDAAVSNSLSGFGGTASSRDLCEALINHALKVTAQKRELLEQPEWAQLRMPAARLKQLDLPSPEEELGEEQAHIKRKWLADILKRTSGKLDHATVVAYEVGYYNGDENEVYEERDQDAYANSKCPSACPSLPHSEP